MVVPTKTPNKKLTNYKYAVLRNGKDPPTTKKKAYTDEIKQLLILHNNSFENWRYLYEIKNEKGFEYNFDFRKMDVFIFALVDIIKQLKKGKSRSFVR